MQLYMHDRFFKFSLKMLLVLKEFKKLNYRLGIEKRILVTLLVTKAIKKYED